jgi:transketolase
MDPTSFFRELLALAGERTARSNVALAAVADIIRLYSLYLCRFRESHVGSCMGLADIIAVLYARKRLSYDLGEKRFTDPRYSDPLHLSVGHAVSAFYAMFHMLDLIEAGDFIRARTMGCLPHHPETRLTPDLFFLSSGSLGQGLSEALGAARLLPQRNVFVIMGDGELQEGNAQEAIAFAGQSKLANLVTVVDCNGIQLSGATKDHSFTADYITGLFTLAGWHVVQVQGHDFDDIERGFSAAFACRDAPSVLVAHTVMGKGVTFMEAAAARGESTFHHGYGTLREDSLYQCARDQVQRSLDRALGELGPEWQEAFRAVAVRPEDFALTPPVQDIHKHGEAPNTQDVFISAICELVQGDVPVAFLTADLTGSGSTGSKRVSNAVKEKLRQEPSYPGFFLDVGIREQLASTMLKGIARAARQRAVGGTVTRQVVVPVFSCYAAMVNLIVEPMRMAARDDVQLIINTTLFGLLYARGGNSHNSSVLPLTNFLPVFAPATPDETRRIVQTAAQRILRGQDGRCCVATNRVPLTPAWLDSETLLEGDTIEEVNRLVQRAWEDGDPWEEGAYLVGDPPPTGGPVVTIVTSGPMLYLSYQAKRDLLKRDGIHVRIIHVISYSRELSERLAEALGGLLPEQGTVLTIWDGDRSILYDRVCAAAMTARKRDLRCVAHGPTEDDDASGTEAQVIAALRLRTSDITELVRTHCRS